MRLSVRWGFDGGLFGVDHVEYFDIVLVEGEAGEVVGVGVDEMFGDGIEFGHEPCLGLRVEWYPQRARIVPRRWLRGEEEAQRRGSVAERIQGWEVEDRSGVPFLWHGCCCMCE